MPRSAEIVGSLPATRIFKGSRFGGPAALRDQRGATHDQHLREAFVACSRLRSELCGATPLDCVFERASVPRATSTWSLGATPLTRSVDLLRSDHVDNQLLPGTYQRPRSEPIGGQHVAHRHPEPACDSGHGVASPHAGSARDANGPRPGGSSSFCPTRRGHAGGGCSRP